MTITLPLNLSSVGVSPGENTQHLDSIGPDGLTLVSGYSIGAGIGISPFDPISVPALLDGLNPAATSQGYLTQNATTANFGHLHLVAGETLTINYDFKPGDDYFNDFAWQVIGQGAADEQATLLANVQQVVNNEGATSFHSTTTINQTGDYDLLLGVSDLGDNQKHSTLVVHNVTVTAPDNIYTVDPNGLRLSDGSKILANGGLLLPSGVAESNVISAGGQGLISYLISQDGAGIVSHDAGGVVSHDGGGLLSNNSGTLISQDGAGVVSNDGGSLLSNNSGTLISQDGAGFIGHNGSSVVSNDGASLIAAGGGNFHVNAFESVDAGPTGQDLIVTTGFLDKSTAAAGDTVNVSYQIKSDGTEAAAASTSKVYLSSDDTITTSDQLLGSLPDPSLAVGTAISDTIDVKLPSDLAAGTYYIGVIADADAQVTEGDETNNVSSRFAITVTGAPTSAEPAAKVGGEILVSPPIDDANFTQQYDPQVASLATGKFAVAWVDNLNQDTGFQEVREQLLNPDGTKSGPSVVVSTETTGDQQQPSVTGLSGGRYVVAWADKMLDTAGTDTQSDIHAQIFNADGTEQGAEFAMGVTSGNEAMPNVASLSDGGFVAVWRGADSQVNGVNSSFGQRFSADGTPVGSEFGLGASAYLTETDSAVAAGLHDGGFAVAYREVNQYADDESGVYVDIYDANGLRTHQEVHANTTSDGAQGMPAIATLANGNFAVSWIDESTVTGDSPLAAVRAQIFDPSGTRIGGEITVSTTTPTQFDPPTLSALADGRFVVSYDVSEYNGGFVTATNIRAQLYNADGTPSGDAFAVNTPDTTGVLRENSPAATELSDGHFVVVDQKGDGASSEIDAQLFGLGDQGGTPTPVTFTKIPTDADDGAAPRALATGDVNGDGKVDIVTADFQSDTVSVLIGAGDGTFATTSIPFQGGHAGVVLSEVNGDGKLDIVTADYDGDTASVLLGHGDGTFGTPTSMAVGHNPYNLSVADVTGDGIADIVVANSGAYTVSLLEGNGDGTFQAATQIGRNTSPGFVVVADVNKDGWADLVTTDYNDGTVTVLLGQSDGTFAAQGALAVGANPVPAVVADTNGDGNLDIVVGNNQDASVSVLLGHGDGIFAGQIKTAVGIDPIGLAVRDVNGDDKPDVVTGNYGDSTVSVLLGNGDGTFAAQTPLAVGANPYAAAIADFNGDGNPDIATANYIGDSVSILLNNAVPDTGGGTTPTPPVDTNPTVPNGGTSPTQPGGSDPNAGTHDASYIDVFGNTVVDTSDAQNRLVKEVITGTDGNVLSTETLTYGGDGTYTTHSDLVTTAGSVSVDAAYGVLGELSETIYVDGVLSSTATVTYNPDGSILRHVVTVGQPGSEDILYGRTGDVISDTHVDTGGTTPTIPSFVLGFAPTHIVAPDPGTHVIDGHAGAADILIGGLGTDTVSYAASTTAVAIGLEVNATWDGAYGDMLSSIENAVGSPFDDILVGDDGNNILDGGPAGADLISGGFGADTVSYASSHAAVIVDLGAQLTWDGSVNDHLSSIENAIGSSLDDILVGDDGNNVLDGGAGGADLIGGGFGSDTVSYASSMSAVSIDLGAQLTWDGSVNDGLSSIENAIGSAFDDTIVGDNGDNVLDGGAGGADHIAGGLGIDTVSYAHSATAVSIDLGAQLTWDGSANDGLSSIENAIGSAFDDTIVGDNGDNVLDGGAGGADHIAGGLGIDTVSYAASATAVSIDLAAQLTFDGSSVDTLSSIENAIGSQFNDTLAAGAGISVLTGGGGSDTFAFRAGFGHGVITDFATSGAAPDVIRVDHGLFANDDPLSAAHDIGDDVILVANGGADITLLGLHKADLAMTDFHFG